jgi:hypothetical protein
VGNPISPKYKMKHPKPVKRLFTYVDLLRLYPKLTVEAPKNPKPEKTKALIAEG